MSGETPRPRSESGTGRQGAEGANDSVPSWLTEFTSQFVAFRHGDETVVAQIINPPEDAPEDVVEGLRRRATLMVGGTCPCGALRLLPSRAERRLAKRRGRPIEFVQVEHDHGCPAGHDVLLERLRAWRAGR